MKNHNENNPESSDKTAANPLTWVMFAVASLVMLFVKPSQYLRERAYSSTAFGRIGLIAGMVAAAACGVRLGSAVSHLGIEWWLSFGFGGVIATYYYL